jgi:hypothetical protein
MALIFTAAVVLGVSGVLAPPAAPTEADDPLHALRVCESGNDYGINTGNGYYGAYQFSLPTWRAVGGEGYPHLAAPEEQDHRAWRLLTEHGWQHWPHCGRYLR